MAFIRSYVVPEGFPDSVIPSYVPYMTWRALKVILFCVLTVPEWNIVGIIHFLVTPSVGNSNVVLVVALLWWCDGCFHDTNTP